MLSVVPATTERFRLGEGPVWDAVRQRLLWVDILAGQVLEGRLNDGRVGVSRRWDFPGMVGAVAVGPDGDLLVAAQEQLVLLRNDGSRLDGRRIVPPGEHRRLNDGGTDPAGRFVVGTLALDGSSERELLVRLEADGGLTEFDGDLKLSNGLAWSTDGAWMFNVDTLRRVIYVRRYDAASGVVGDRRVHLRFSDRFPDGIAMDSADHLWVALWGAGEVRRYSPDGELAERVTVPAPHTSSLAFAGNDLKQLVITTATAELTERQLVEYPDSGRLFVLTVEVAGQATVPWCGLGIGA